MFTINVCKSIGQKVIFDKIESSDASIIVNQQTFGKDALLIYIDFTQVNGATLSIKTKIKEKSIPNNKSYYLLKQIGSMVSINDLQLKESLAGVIPIGLSENIDSIDIEFEIIGDTTSTVEVYLTPVTKYV